MRRVLATVAAASLALGASTLVATAPVGASGSHHHHHHQKASPFVQAQLTDGPLALWTLDDPPGATAAEDASGNGHAAALASCVALGQPGPTADGATSALLGSVAGCDATWVPTSSYSGSFTVEAWVDPQGSVADHYRTIVATRGGPGAYAPDEFGFDLKLQATTDPGGQELWADVGDGSGWLANTGVPLAWTPGTWYLLAATVTPAAVAFYVDGQLLGSTPLLSGGAPLLFDPTRPVVLGGNPRYDSEPSYEHENVEADVADVALYPSALTATQLLAHFAAADVPTHGRGHGHQDVAPATR